MVQSSCMIVLLRFFTNFRFVLEEFDAFFKNYYTDSSGVGA